MNQSSASEWLTSREATALLDVSRPTLYAYVSRGLVTSRPVEGQRARLYRREDLERLRTRQSARSGHAAVAAGALRWGEPVLDSSITEVTAAGPRYRGRDAVELADSRTFEEVAETLWRLPEIDEPWPTPRLSASVRAIARRVASSPAGVFAADVLPAVVSVDALSRPPVAGPEAAVREARRLCRLFPVALAATYDRTLVGPQTQASAFLQAFGRRRGASHVNQALILIADHELNPSTFAARVAAAAGSSLHHAVLGALGTFAGSRHGAASERVELLLEEVAELGAAHVVRRRLRLGETLPGFGHPLYPDGDPRFPPLMSLAERHAPKLTKAVRDLLDATALAGAPPPNVDMGLVALCRALGLPSGAPRALFACGRIAGWIAHILEQRADGFMVRPRARFVG